MRNLHKIATIVMVALSISTWAQATSGSGRAAVLDYIDQFQSIATAEMERTGIPASIKLAQGILESNAGRSYLALEGNNHFGIKCGGAWSGGKVYRKDDDYDRHGKLRHSCFRSYESPEESYIAHSNFLTDYNKAHRYGFLFDLESRDYKAWARGLKRAGYATNPKYANLLINIIESYDLYKYDELGGVIAQKDAPDSEDQVASVNMTSDDGRLIDSRKRSSGFFDGTAELYRKFEHNGVSYIRTSGGDQLYVIALELGMEVEELMEYNDFAYDREEPIPDGKRVYLEAKRGRFKGRAKMHRVDDAERMVDIAQLYGIKVKKLYKRNRMEEGSEPATGERIFINAKRPKSSEVELRRFTPRKPSIDEPVLPNMDTDSDATSEETTQQEVVEPVRDSAITIQKESDVPGSKEPVNKVEETIPPVDRREEMTIPDGLKKIHIVAKGETLYRIAKMYQTTIDQIKAMNELRDNTIQVGQELIIE